MPRAFANVAISKMGPWIGTIVCTSSFHRWMLFNVAATDVTAPEFSGPFGAVGIGETTLSPTAAAIANAIADATGARVWEMPMTPERVLAALEDRPENAW